MRAVRNDISNDSPVFSKIVLNDTSIRIALKRYLADDHGRIIADEFPIASYSAIADIVTLDRSFCCYEIKSDLDSLNRLANQIDWYRPVFDHITVVTTRKHEAKARAMLPRWCGILIAEHLPIVFDIVQDATENPYQKATSILDLLSTVELRRLARESGIKGYTGDDKFRLISRISESVEQAICRSETFRYIASRPAWERVF